MGSILQLRGAATGSIPGPINNLATPTLTGTSVTTNFSVPTGTISGYQYRIDGGTAQTLSGGPGGSITGMTTGLPVNVEVRAINGGNLGPWSNLVVANPGLTINITFDTSAANLDGNNNGSWEVTPSNVFTTVAGSVWDWPDVGFANSGDRDGATAVVNQFISDFRKLVDSTATINLFIGMGRYKSQSVAGDWLAWSTGNGNGASAAHSERVSSGSTFANYAAYQSQISSLTNTTQKSLWPAGGTVPDPGAFPGVFFLSTAGMVDIQNAIWNNSVQTTNNWIVVNPFDGAAWNFDTDPSTHTSGKIKFNYIIWHEYLQSMGFIQNAGIAGFSAKSIMAMLYYDGSGIAGHYWDGGSAGAVVSVNDGVTSLGAIQITPATDPGSLVGAVGNSAYAYNNPITSNSNMLPASPLQIPSGNLLPLRSQQDGKIFCAHFPPSAAMVTMAGL